MGKFKMSSNLMLSIMYLCIAGFFCIAGAHFASIGDFKIAIMCFFPVALGLNASHRFENIHYYNLIKKELKRS